MGRRLFLLALLTACLPAGSAEPQLAEEAVEVSYEKGMYIGRFTFVVAVPPAVAWEVLTDFDRMAAFVPNLESSRIVDRSRETIRVVQSGRMDFGPFTFRYDSERVVDARENEGLLISHALAGSAKHMLSRMQLSPEGAGTRLDYRVEMVPDTWIPSGLGVGLMRHQLAEQFTAMAREMVRRQQRRRTS